MTIYMPSPYGRWLSVPLIKQENNQYIVTGTWYTPQPVFLKEFYLSLSSENIDKIIDEIDNNSKRVWVLDRKNLQYSATLLSLSDKLAEELSFNHQIRTDLDGVILGKNEICIADEILAEKFLQSRGIQREQTHVVYPVPVISVDEAWQIVKNRQNIKSSAQMAPMRQYWHNTYIDF